MANRSVKSPQDLPIERLPGASPMKVTRRDVARRELIHAIRMHFWSGDPVVVHLLAAAARDVITPVARAAGGHTIADKLEKNVRPEFLKAWRSLLKEPYNFFKHGGSDPDTELAFFNPGINDMLIFEGCSDYRTAFGSYEPQMIVFLAWHFATYPHLLNDSANELREATAAQFDPLDTAGRIRLGKELIQAIESGLLPTPSGEKGDRDQAGS